MNDDAGLAHELARIATALETLLALLQEVIAQAKIEATDVHDADLPRS